MSLKSQRNEKEISSKKIFEVMMAENFPNLFMEKHEFIDSKYLMNSIQAKLNVKHTQIHYNQTKDIEKHLENNQGKLGNNICIYLIRNHAD